MNGKKKFYVLIGLYQIVLILVVFFSVNGVITFVSAQAEQATQQEATAFDYYNSPTAMILALSSAIAVGAAVLGSAYTIKTVGTSAISALTEREESFFKAFLVVALGEALAIYGLIIGILLWTKIPTPPG